MDKIVQLILSTSVTYGNPDDEQPPPTYNTSPIPFWNIFFIFNHLLLHKNHPKTQSIATLLPIRIAKLNQGRIRELYDEAFAFPTPPTDQQTLHLVTDDEEPSFDNATQFCPEAQAAANSDNFHTAYQRILSTLPVAKLHPPVIERIKQTLFPPRLLNYTPPNSTPATEPPAPDTRAKRRKLSKANQFRRITSDDTITTLRKTKRGTAPGPFCDPIDSLRDYAMFCPNTTKSNSDDDSPKSSSSTYPYIDNFTALLQLALDGDIPQECHPTFSCNYFLALHKDPDDHDKIRPLGIGSAFRRISAALAITVLGFDAAEFLLPQGQFGIGIPSGLDFIIHSTMADLERHLNPTAPTRALLMLDIVNMFNAVSREACRSVLETNDKFSALIPFFDMLYSNNNLCWYRKPDGTFDTFEQAEGFAQGCPLSPFLASLVLNVLLTDLNAKLRNRSKARLEDQSYPGDDNLGSLAQTKSYIDDTNLLLPFRDISWFLASFTELGAPLGIHLNYNKTKILTSLTSTSPIFNHNISPQDAHHLCSALATLGKNSEILQGTRFLGQPLGSSDFACQFLASKALDYTTSTSRLLDRLNDTQTQCSLFKNCTQSTIPHLLASDVYYNLDLENPPNLSTWSSTFTDSIVNSNHHFLSQLLNTPYPLPNHALFIASYPAREGGVGLRDPIPNAIASFAIPLSRSVHYAQHGIPLGSDRVLLLANHYASSLHNWKAEPLRLFKILRHYLPPILLATTPDRETPPTITAFISARPRKSILRNLYHTHKLAERTTLTPTFPPHIQVVLPQLLNKNTSFPFNSLSRRQRDHRIAPDTYTIALKRKLRLPIINPTPASLQCPCGTTPDIYGDHFFHCKSAPGHKTALHNRMRDTLLYIFRTLGPLTGWTNHEYDVACEPTQLLPLYPGNRPADVGVTLQPQASPAHAQPHTYLAIDVTITAAPKLPLPDTPVNPYKPYAAQAQKVHWTSTRDKFHGRRHGPTANLNQQNLTLIPFSIDPYGSLGYFANRLLYDPPPDKPPWHHSSDFTSEAAFQAFSKAMTSPHSFLAVANSKYDAITPFGHTHNTRTPEQWATQILGLNFVTGSALFLLRATAATVPSPTTIARAAPKFPRPPLGVNLAFFRPRRILRADDPPMTPGR
jgi:hypothetical protein